MRILGSAPCLVLVLLMAPAAQAQERLFTMADLGAHPHVAARSALGTARGNPGESGQDPGFFLRDRDLFSYLELEGRGTIGDFAFTAIAPLALVADGPPQGVGLGNPTLDVLYRRPLPAGDHVFVVGGGIAGSLGLASSPEAEATASYYYQDLGRYWRYGHTLRLHGDAGWSRGPTFAELELGIDHHIGTGEYRESRQTLARLGVGVGVRPARSLALLAELTTLSNLLDVNPTADDDGHFVHALQLGARWGDCVSLGLSLFVPLHTDIGLGDTAELALAVELLWHPCPPGPPHRAP